MGEEEVKRKRGNPITKYFKETFRRHTGAEYSELLTRGMKGEGDLNRKYPWAYIRLFALIFVLFAVFLLIVRFTSNELFVPTITVLASLCFNFPFLVLLFELYPKRDISFMSVCLALLLGGTTANVLAQIMFNIFPPANAWLSAVYSGFFEELPKMLAVIAVIIAMRKNSPLAGFLLGAAVGCGFSIVEDMGYIFTEANEMPFMNLTTIINVSVARGFSAFCTHTLWTAAIGWAYCHFTRHFANVAFYGVTLLSCGLHIAWDLPLKGVAIGFIYAGCVIVALTECSLILYFERRKVFAERKLLSTDLYKNDVAVNQIWEQAAQEEQEQRSLNKNDPLFWKHWGQVAVSLGAVLMAIIGVLYCSIPFRETYGTQTFKDAESFISFMQDGRVFDYVENRQYDSHNTADDIRTFPDTVIQPEVGADGYLYGYVYTVNHDNVSGNDYYFPVTVSVTVKNDLGVDTVYYKEDVYQGGKPYAAFFRINSDVTGYNFTSNGDVTVFIYNADFVRDLSEWRYLSLFCTFAGIFGAVTVCYISLTIKSWRVKKQCLTTDVSSAK